MKRSSDSISDLIPSFQRHLAAKNRSRTAITNYSGAAETFEAHLASVRHSTYLCDIHSRDIESFIVQQLNTCSDSTAGTRFRYLHDQVPISPTVLKSIALDEQMAVAA